MLRYLYNEMSSEESAHFLFFIENNPAMMAKFKGHGLQIAMGVPWRIDEPEGLKTFRLGLFGLDKMRDSNKCVGVLQEALDAVLEECGHVVPEKTKAA